MASSVVLKEQTMRRNDLRGDHEASGAVAEMMSRSWVRCDGAKMSRLMRFWG